MVKRICVYIDGANFVYGIKSINKRYSDFKFDFEGYIRFLIKTDSLVKVNYYNASLKQKYNKELYWRQSKFFTKLKKLIKWNVTLCKRKPRTDIEGEEYHIIKGDDVILAIDMISDAYEDKYDKAILISSDGDFTPLVERVRKLNKEVEICYFKDCVSNELLKSSNKNNLINKKIVKRFFYSKDKKRNKIIT
tara:strand:+ start:614 stop:1189 length:576 start_codon:yes stop_codon:yes gene_type:complete